MFVAGPQTKRSTEFKPTEMWIWFSFERKWALITSYIFGHFLFEVLYWKVQNKTEEEEEYITNLVFQKNECSVHQNYRKPCPPENYKVQDHK